MLTEFHVQIAELCRRYHVSRLDLVGSAARDDFAPDRSDFDFLVEFADDMPAPALGDYFGLKESLETLLGRPVDLIMTAAVTSPYLRADLARDRTTLNAA